MDRIAVSSRRLSPLRHAANLVARFLASLKLAVLLMILLATVLAVATLLETRHGTPYAHWFVYKSSWFAGLLALLGVSIFFAAAVRYPWKRHQTGFVVTHIGLLVLLAGSIQSTLSGVEGRISLTEGETTSYVTLPERSQITAIWSGRPNEAPYEFLFDGGPTNWSSGAQQDLGEVDGVTRPRSEILPRRESDYRVGHGPARRASREVPRHRPGRQDGRGELAGR